jgi:hypothetical protein
MLVVVRESQRVTASVSEAVNLSASTRKSWDRAEFASEAVTVSRFFFCRPKISSLRAGVVGRKSAVCLRFADALGQRRIDGEDDLLRQVVEQCLRVLQEPFLTSSRPRPPAARGDNSLPGAPDFAELWGPTLRVQLHRDGSK